MIAIIVISFLALIGAVFSIYIRRRTLSDATDNRVLPAPRSVGLFDRTDPTGIEEKRQQSRASRRQALLELARSGDLNTLSAAHSAHDSQLYDDVLDGLIEWSSERQENLAALVSLVSKSNDLRANKQLARRVIETWTTAPDRRSTTEMIHIAALSDDAETYDQAVTRALEFWRSGRLTGFRPEELVELFLSQYWVIAPEARRGGVGFALKRRLLGVRRELATATPVR